MISITNYFEQRLFDKWLQTMSKEDAEELLKRLRREQNGDDSDVSLQIRYDQRRRPGAKRESRRMHIIEAANRRAINMETDPEHPVLRKYVPAQLGTDTSHMTKIYFQAMKADIAQSYGVPLRILEASSLVEHETKIPELKKRLETPNQDAYKLLLNKETKHQGLRQLIGDELYGLFRDPGVLASYAKEIQRCIFED